jgi:GMP synthase (glutamine-hydrolysing)
MFKRVLVIQNDAPETLGLYETFLREKTELTLVHAYKMRESDEFPPVKEFDAFVVGPTPIPANDALSHDFLRKEWKYLREIVDSGKPTLGVCCGGQILARILGGEVKKSPTMEIGIYEATLTDQGVWDPLFRGFPPVFPVFHWHSDMFTVPPGGELLATGDPCPIQSFSKGNVRGVIFHLEITAEDAEKWAAAYPEEPAHIGRTAEQVIRECMEKEPEMARLSMRLVDNLLAM